VALLTKLAEIKKKRERERERKRKKEEREKGGRRRKAEGGSGERGGKEVTGEERRAHDCIGLTEKE